MRSVDDIEILMGMASLGLVLLGLSQSFGPTFIPLLSRLDLFLAIRDGMRAWKRSRERTWPTGSLIFCNCISMHSNLSNEGMIELLTTLMFLRIPFITSEPILLLGVDLALSLLSWLCNAFCFLVVPSLLITSLVLHQCIQLANNISTMKEFLSFVTDQSQEFWTIFTVIIAVFATTHHVLTLNVGIRKDALARRWFETKEKKQEEEEGEEEQKQELKMKKIFTALSSPSSKSARSVISPRIAKEERSEYEQV